MLAACCWRLTGSRKSKCNAPHESRQPTARAPVSPPTCSVLFHWASLRTARRTSRRYARPYLTGITPGQASLRYAYMPVSIKAIPARQISGQQRHDRSVAVFQLGNLPPSGACLEVQQTSPTAPDSSRPARCLYPVFRSAENKPPAEPRRARSRQHGDILSGSRSRSRPRSS